MQQAPVALRAHPHPPCGRRRLLHNNFILDQLHSLHPDFLTGRAKHIDFGHGDRLAIGGEEIAHVFFPTSGMVSIVAELDEGERIETAMVGYEGMIGGSALLGATIQVGTSLGQIPGRGLSIPLQELVELARENDNVRKLFVQSEQFVLAQAQQAAACNARHPVAQRFSTWILRASDAARSDVLHLTQEYIAEMLGVQRPSVSVFAHGLQDEGLISYRRGVIRIVDREALERRACKCYASLRSMRERIFGLGDESEPEKSARSES
jgi:CRP-like cAMP-binding protein